MKMDPPARLQKILHVIDFTRQFVKYRKWIVRQLKSVLLKWAWIMILRIPPFSVLEAVYKFYKAKTRTVKTSFKARQEFEAEISLSSLIYANLKRTFGDTAYLTDASRQGRDIC